MWTWAGTKRSTGKNIGVEPTQIYIRLGGLPVDVHYWIQDWVFPPDEIAIRLHHGLVFIHPFPNGNGRHARLMADLLIVQLGARPFTWGGGGTLQDIGDLQNRYIHDLREADHHHDFGPLLEFARS